MGVDQRALAAGSIVLEDPPLDFAPLSPVRSQLVVFDFDWSLAEQDSDRWIHELLSPELRKEFIRLKDSMQFTDMCAHLLVELHKQGRTREELLDALRQMPLHPAMIRGVRQLHAQKEPQTDFFLLSNSNEVYLSTILGCRGLRDVFTEVVTNPAEFEPSGLLRLRRRVPKDGPQHGCTIGCSANMCKGQELDAFLARHQERDYARVIYVGDGANDFCPVQQLREQDVAFVRRNRGLARRIYESGGVRCQVRYWGGAWEAEQLLRLLGAGA